MVMNPCCSAVFPPATVLRCHRCSDPDATPYWFNTTAMPTNDGGWAVGRVFVVGYFCYVIEEEEVYDAQEISSAAGITGWYDNCCACMGPCDGLQRLYYHLSTYFVSDIYSPLHDSGGSYIDGLCCYAGGLVQLGDGRWQLTVSVLGLFTVVMETSTPYHRPRDSDGWSIVDDGGASTSTSYVSTGVQITLEQICCQPTLQPPDLATVTTCAATTVANPFAYATLPASLYVGDMIENFVADPPITDPAELAALTEWDGVVHVRPDDTSGVVGDAQAWYANGWTRSSPGDPWDTVDVKIKDANGDYLKSRVTVRFDGYRVKVNFSSIGEYTRTCTIAGDAALSSVIDRAGELPRRISIA